MRLGGRARSPSRLRALQNLILPGRSKVSSRGIALTPSLLMSAEHTCALWVLKQACKALSPASLGKFWTILPSPESACRGGTSKLLWLIDMHSNLACGGRLLHEASCLSWVIEVGGRNEQPGGGAVTGSKRRRTCCGPVLPARPSSLDPVRNSNGSEFYVLAPQLASMERAFACRG